MSVRTWIKNGRQFEPQSAYGKPSDHTILNLFSLLVRVNQFRQGGSFKIFYVPGIITDSQSDLPVQLSGRDRLPIKLAGQFELRSES